MSDDFAALVPSVLQESLRVGGGRISWDKSGEQFEFVGVSGEVTVAPQAAVLGSRLRICDPLLVWDPPAFQWCLLGTEVGSVFVHLGCESGEFTTFSTLSRFPDLGQRRVSILARSDRLLVIYESGIVCGDSKGRVLWERDALQIDWHFVGVEGTRVRYESEFRGSWSYALVDGSGAPPECRESRQPERLGQ